MATWLEWPWRLRAAWLSWTCAGLSPWAPGEPKAVRLHVCAFPVALAVQSLRMHVTSRGSGRWTGRSSRPASTPSAQHEPHAHTASGPKSVMTAPCPLGAAVRAPCGPGEPPAGRAGRWATAESPALLPLCAAGSKPHGRVRGFVRVLISGWGGGAWGRRRARHPTATPARRDRAEGPGRPQEAHGCRSPWGPRPSPRGAAQAPTLWGLQSARAARLGLWNVHHGARGSGSHGVSERGPRAHRGHPQRPIPKAPAGNRHSWDPRTGGCVAGSRQATEPGRGVLRLARPCAYTCGGSLRERGPREQSPGRPRLNHGVHTRPPAARAPVGARLPPRRSASALLPALSQLVLVHLCRELRVSHMQNASCTVCRAATISSERKNGKRKIRKLPPVLLRFWP